MVCGGLRWFVVVCGGLWWFVVDCGGLSFSHTLSQRICLPVNVRARTPSVLRLHVQRYTNKSVVSLI